MGKQLGLQLQSLEVRKLDDFESAFALATSGHAEALLSIDGPIILSNRDRTVELAAKSRLPAFYRFRDFVDAGGLMCYGPNLPDLYRRAATYVDKILKGTKPADIPVEQPTKFDFVINLKTMKALGLAIPKSILAQATEVVE